MSCDSLFQLKPDEDLATKIIDEINNEDKLFNLSSLSSFEWVSIIILGPYTVIQDIENKFDLNLSNISRNGIEHSDSFNLLVFLLDKKSVKISEVSLSFVPVHRIFQRENLKIKTEGSNYVLLNNQVRK